MTAPDYQIEIADEQKLNFDHPPLIDVIGQILDDHQIATAEISLAVVDDPTIRRLNVQYLQHDYETDVISFVLDWDEDQQHLTGQLIVSTETALRVAKEVGSSLEEELLLYVIHGTLHLVGYDDKEPADAQVMRENEKRYLQRAGKRHRGFESDASLHDPKLPSGGRQDR
ncbi:MAG: rRNA maturation RNase YbeY [Planctomycetota bacterium]